MGGCKEMLEEMREALGEVWKNVGMGKCVGVGAGGLGKCWLRCEGRGSGGVKKCWGRCGKVCRSVGRCDKMLGEVWGSVEGGVEKCVGGGVGKCVEVWGT